MSLTKTQARKLKELRGYLTMERASFGFETEKVTVTGFGENVTTTKDAFVKDSVSNYLESWAIPIIDELLEGSETR